MALKKEVRQYDGVVTNYHRISLLTQSINRCTSIAVLSYVDGEAREGEKDSTLPQPYQTSVSYEMKYDPTMTIESAYEYLKTLPQFEGAVDI